MGNLSLVMDIAVAMRDKNFIFNKLKYIKNDISKMVRSLDFDETRYRNILQVKEYANDDWIIEKNFSTAEVDFFIFSTRLGFVIDYAHDIAVIRVPCAWKMFCTENNWRIVFQTCGHMFFDIFGSTKILYIDSESFEGEKCLEAVYDRSTYDKPTMPMVLDFLRMTCDKPISDVDFKNSLNTKEILTGYIVEFFEN